MFQLSFIDFQSKTGPDTFWSTCVLWVVDLRLEYI